MVQLAAALQTDNEPVSPNRPLLAYCDLIVRCAIFFFLIRMGTIAGTGAEMRLEALLYSMDLPTQGTRRKPDSEYHDYGRETDIEKLRVPISDLGKDISFQNSPRAYREP